MENSCCKNNQILKDIHLYTREKQINNEISMSITDSIDKVLETNNWESLFDALRSVGKFGKIIKNEARIQSSKSHNYYALNLLRFL